MGSTEKRGYWFPAGSDDVSNFPGQIEILFMKKLDTDMDEALTAAIALARIPNLPASKITSGTFAAARLPAATTSAQGALSAADKAKLDGIPEGGGGASVTALGTENLNDVTGPGFYVQNATANATTARNYPPLGQAGGLLIWSNGSMTFQIYTAYSSAPSSQGSYMYVRGKYNTTWGDWKQVPFMGDLTATNITDATATGRSVLTAASAAAARSAIGAGTSSLSTGTAAELTTGTATTARAWTAKILADYVKANGGGGGWTPPAWETVTPNPTAFDGTASIKVRDEGDGTAKIMVTGMSGPDFYATPNTNILLGTMTSARPAGDRYVLIAVDAPTAEARPWYINIRSDGEIRLRKNTGAEFGIALGFSDYYPI